MLWLRMSDPYSSGHPAFRKEFQGRILFQAEDVIEFLILFLILPTLIYFGKVRAPALLMLWVLTAYCGWVLWREGRVDAMWLSSAGLGRQLPSILAMFLAFTIVAAGLVYRYAARDFFGFVRKNPVLWAIVMVGYPVLSVYPQGIVYRAFFFDRYRELFPRPWLMVLMSGVAFAYMHIVFRNWIAVVLTLVGGLLFATRYAQTGSLFVSSFEHALYGCCLFTVGLGRWFFYEGQWRSWPPDVSRC